MIKDIMEGWDVKHVLATKLEAPHHLGISFTEHLITNMLECFIPTFHQLKQTRQRRQGTIHDTRVTQTREDVNSTFTRGT